LEKEEFLSAKSKESEIKKGMDIGADAYITKPFSTKQLMESIKGILNK
jgi:DNA-binding response OmpR family regulator